VQLSVDKLFAICVDSFLRSDQQVLTTVLSHATYAQTWEAFIKWSIGQFELGRAVNCQPFGVFGYGPAQGDSRSIQLQVADQFLRQNGLTRYVSAETEEAEDFVPGPSVKVSYVTVSKISGLAKGIVTAALSNIFSLIGQLLASTAEVEIDLGMFGRIEGKDRQIRFTSINKSKPNYLFGKSTVQSLLAGFRSATVEKELSDQALPRSIEDLETTTKKMQKSATLPTHLLKTRPKMLPTLNVNLILAGTNPRAKQQDFSALAEDVEKLLSTHFVRPQAVPTRFPPVLDEFSRTLASPYSGTKQYLSPSTRLGSNYTPSAKLLIIDVETRKIRFLPQENKRVLEANIDPMVDQMDTESGLKIRAEGKDTESLKRDYCFKRYVHYIEFEISTEVIAPIRDMWVAKILDMIPSDSHLPQETKSMMIDAMMNETNKDYYKAGRKAILDYVLKDPDEKKRLGLEFNPDPPIDYGSRPYMGITPSDQWQRNVMAARMLVSDSLSLSEATLGLMRLWADYENYLLVNIPERFEVITLSEFISRQEERMQTVHDLLRTEWSVRAGEIIQPELENLDHEQALTFFESVSTLMSNQLRQLIKASVTAYVQFFLSFKLTRYPTADEMITFQGPTWPNAFLKITLGAENDTFIFTEPLSNIVRDCLRMVESVVRKSENIPRPDNAFTRDEKKQFLWSVSVDDEMVKDAVTIIRKTVEENLQVLDKTLVTYDTYIWLISELKQVEKFIREDHSIEDYRKLISKYVAVEKEVRATCPVRIRMSMAVVECQEINKYLCKQCDEFVYQLTKDVAMKNKGRMSEIYSSFQDMHATFSPAVETAERLVQTDDYLMNCKEKLLPALLTKYDDVRKWLGLLYDTAYKVTPDDIDQLQKCVWFVNNIDLQMEERQEKLLNERASLEGKLKARCKDYTVDLEAVEQEFSKIKIKNERQMYKSVCEELDSMKARLEHSARELEEINQKRELFGWLPFENNKLEELQRVMKPFDELWHLEKNRREKMEVWEKNPIKSQDPDAIDKESKQMHSQATKLANLFKDKFKAPADVANLIAGDMSTFRLTIPVFQVICTPGMKERHWEEISRVVQREVKVTEASTFRTLDGKEMVPFVEQLVEVAQSASREYSNQKTLEKMEADWAEIRFELKDWSDTGTYILLGAAIEVIQQLLDEQTITTQTMKGSPYAKVFLDRIIDWEDWLLGSTRNIAIWIKVQTLWIGLEPVFASEDIKKQLAQEFTMFSDVDKQWRQIMEQVKKDTLATVVTRIPSLLEILQTGLSKLEHVQHELNQFLEKKRLQFPRFFFLSNEDLLSILKETKNPRLVQPHLKKCFEGIKSLQFDEDDKISAMISQEGEKVDYLRQIDPAAAKGSVEQWLKEVELCMLESTKDIIIKALQDAHRDRKEWVQQHKGQAVLCVSMTKWTEDAEKAMREGGLPGLSAFLQTCNSQLSAIVSLVRGNISDLVRCTLKALIVLDVHARDVINQLVTDGFADVTDFSWLAQMRYYWENNNTVVRIINAEVDYCYEYLGNSERLVITPLTDRCYRTLCGAVHLNYGGAPEGPAGTGKTETVKDLAKALARMCVVFNCSDGLDFKAMGKFFKGLAATGGWSCFDEFNRIDPEVLSVVAEQLLTIQQTIRKGMTQFQFEGSLLPIKKTCNCFITMNPGYAGRSELPDNLKALFRTVAMMVPDYALIAENSLYSYGFHNARPLAQKIVATYKLCSEQLSSQHHYDYGMRAVKSVLLAAGNLKRKYPDQDESILMLRAINDVNLAKFLAFDLPLFEGITSDLFPGVKLPEPDYEALLNAMHRECLALKLQPHPYFMKKIIQLYEMIIVRHGLMIVGLPFSGKTCATKVLGNSLTYLHQQSLMNENEVLTFRLNPKSITMSQLYGSFDPISKDWQNGVLSTGFKDFARNDSKQRKWLIFDGPVDALWIENMNTVLDDNKKLCLSSGEIVAMSENMNLIFEPMDLAVASPATVSRCGMVYMEPQEMGWRPIYESWLETLPKAFGEPELMEVNMLFDWILQACLDQVKLKMKEIAPTMPQNLVTSLLKLISLTFKVFDDAEFFENTEEKDRVKIIDCYFLFALIWSVGASVISSQRRNFDIFLRRLLNGDLQEVKKVKKIVPSIPERGNCYEFIFIPADLQWRHWTEAGVGNINADIPNNMQPNEIIVPTVDTVRYTYMLDKMLKAEIPVLLCGNTGTGKTVYVKDVILNKLDQNAYMAAEIGFSAQTTAFKVQELIDEKISARQKKGVFRPPNGKICVIFVDDLNMPELETYGAQPPVEILRQLLDMGGWYDLKENTFKTLEWTRFVSAMGPPGGGRTFITPRFQRHLALISLADFDDETLIRIYSTILHWFFAKGRFGEDITKIENKVVQASMDVYQTSMQKFLPTPLKSHYTFNLRDFSRVILGICMSDAQTLVRTDQLIRLWAHEVFRVFGDRLVDDDDRMILLMHLRDLTKKTFGANFDNVFSHLDMDKNGKVETLDEIRRLLFGSLMAPLGGFKHYEEMQDLNSLTRNCETALDQYNQSSTKPMDLVLFSFAIEHLCRITRILSLPGGHALLIGVGGSGRQSLTKLAAFLCEFEVVEIELTKNFGKEQWRESLKSFLKKAGSGLPTVFIFTDSQIKDKSFLEDINTLLNTGEVPNLFPADEKAEVMELVRSAAKVAFKGVDATPAQLFAFFIVQCKKNLHIALCFSPIGEAFRTRLRMFPSLVNCCTIDWFSEWPADALVSVARKFLNQVELTDEVRLQCVEMCQLFHRSTISWSKRMLNELKRHYYVTPTSYLEMITTFKALLADKRKQISDEKRRYEVGLEKLITTESSVENMKDELTKKQPLLEAASIETEKKMKIVAAESAEAEIVQESVAREEAIAKISADKAGAIKEDCEAELAKAMPILNEALSALKVLQKNDFIQMKSYTNPPEPVKKVMEAVCILKGADVQKKYDQNMKAYYDYWPASQKLLGNPDFKEELEHFDRDNIKEKSINALQKYVTDPIFNRETMMGVSSACAGLCQWVTAIEKYYHVHLIVAPKQEALEVAQAEYNTVMEGLRIKQAELKKVQDRVDILRKDLEETTDRKQALERDVEDCRRRLQRAETLITSLGGEKSTWKERAEKLGEVFIWLTGDILVSAGIIAYSGPFISLYRSTMVAEWVTECSERRIPSSLVFSLVNSLGDPVKIRSWHIDGLPKDAFSTDNGIIMTKARRWPLLIDPQNQANKWIKNMESKEGHLLIIKLSDDNFLKRMEASITVGNSVLIENIGEELDPTLEPLLLKQIVKNTLKLGDTVIDYSKDFKLFMTTKLRNPHYLPELSTKVTLINFMITPEGLADQLLVTVVAEEQPELARRKEELILQSAKNKEELKNIENKILHVISSSEGNILDDDAAITILSESKRVSNEIEKAQKIAEVTETEIDKTRMKYKPFSDCMSLLFFCITDMGNIDPMYQYSLEFFTNLFKRSIYDSEQSEDLDTRLTNLRNHFSYSLYVNICRSLFERHRILFALSLTLKFMEYEKSLDSDELRFLMTGGIGLEERMPEKPQVSWVTDKMWGELFRLNKMAPYAGLVNDVGRDVAVWQEMYDSASPHDFQFPGKWQAALNPFQRLLVVRCIRPDAVIPAVVDFVSLKMGKKFTESPPFKLKEIYKDSSSVTPLVFILSPGSDPFSALNKFAVDKRKELKSKSLGQGQGDAARDTILEAIPNGDWVVLQNCHLAVSWMPILEKIVQEIDPKATHKEFRLWLTSYPSPSFPVTLLQNGIKMTNEPPKGLKANITGSYFKDPINEPNFFNSCKKEKEWKKLLFGLCFFNAVIHERRLYGPLGWNIPYEFSDSDLRISVQQLQMFLNQYDKVPFKALKYLTGECNFGGRVTDDKDRRLIMTLLNDYYVEDIFTESYKFSGIEQFYAPPTGDHQDYLDYVESLPQRVPTEIFGFHSNADITKNNKETQILFDSLLLTASTTGGGDKGGSSVELMIEKIADSILGELPGQFDITAASVKYPVLYTESMNTVLTQELGRYNVLTITIKNSLTDLKKAIKGLVSMSSTLENTLRALFDGKVPPEWSKKSYPSLKPLGSYISDLKARLEFFKDWISRGQPEVYNLSRFYFTQSFLTGALQNFARKYTIPIDEIFFNFEVIAAPAPSRPADGILVNGMFLEGAKWDYGRKVLAESDPKVLYVDCPMIWLKPATERDVYPHYECPLYKTSERRGELSTTGHSTNFVTSFWLASDLPEKHWIKRGVAMLTQLDF